MTDLAGVTLPDNLFWSDEYEWTPVDQSAERTLSGAQVIEESARQKGRPITIEGAWIERSTLDSLVSLEEQVNTTMTLTLPDERTFTTLFRRDGPGVSAQPLFPEAEPTSATLYQVTIRLQEA